MSIFIFFAVLFATAVTDSLWALYMIHVTGKAPFRSALYGTFIHVLTAFTVISYTDNYFYLIPLVIGSFIGTYLTVQYSK